ncbi:MAG: DUF1499 domain-containing protein [Synechococcaceae cyanobacterium SM2_3_1]|nr:DUF1499 domain-containing protein [Synechococcaceae cyanobacterium SM2_3_1]
MREAMVTVPPNVFLGQGLKLILGILGLVILIWGLMGIPAQAASQSPGNRAEMEIVLPASPEQVLAAAPQAFQEWKRGELVQVDSAQRQVQGLSRTNFFKFVDDITVTIQPLESDPGQTRLQIKSVGRVGEYDFGGNQRNIDEYLERLRSLLDSSPA